MNAKRKLATLCYIKKDGRTLMLHRIKKENDIHEGKWNGLGGKLEKEESPEECVIREIKEECGLDITEPTIKGVLTFPSFDKEENDWIVFVFTAHNFTGELIDSNEGKLEWIDDEKILDLNLWEGDKVFLKEMEKDRFFSGKFIYKEGKLEDYKITAY